MYSVPPRRIDPAAIARRQLAAQGGIHRRLHPVAAWTAAVMLFLLSAVLLIAGIFEIAAHIQAGRLSSPWAWFGGALLAGLLCFCRYPLAPVYVFGHEMTHFLAAKLMGRRTGRVRLSWSNGYVEVPQPNAAIILSPYIFPFYLFLSAGLMGLVCLPLPPTLWPAAWKNGSALWLGLCAAYHIVLTLRALSRTQSDLEHCGRPLSLALILSGNLLAAWCAWWIALQLTA